MEDVTTLLTHDRIKNYFIGGFMASIEQKFAQIISNLSKKKTSLYIGDLAWSLGRERFISDLENQNEIETAHSRHDRGNCSDRLQPRFSRGFSVG